MRTMALGVPRKEERLEQVQAFRDGELTTY